MTEPVIAVDRVTKRFDSELAVDGVSLAVQAGEFFSLLGPSGCGKTTTLRMVAGFEQPDAGSIAIDGHDVTTSPPFRRPVNMVFQSYALFPHLDVTRNVAYGLRREGIDRAETARRVGEALELVQLPEATYGGRRPRQLSGGQQQRVALARALVKRPKALLLDEPLGALDLKLRREMQLELKGMQHDLGIAFVYVTHDQEEALTMSDRIAVMDGGRVVQLGTAAEVYERPRTRFVAEFMGVPNILRLPAPSAAEDGWSTVGVPGGRILVPGAVAGGCELAVRPENLHLGPAPEGMSRVAGAVAATAYLGSARKYQIATQMGTQLTVLAPVDAAWTVNDQVEVWWRPEAGVVLDAPSAADRHPVEVPSTARGG